MCIRADWLTSFFVDTFVARSYTLSAYGGQEPGASHPGGISEVQRRLRNAKIVDPASAEAGSVDLGTRVTLRVVGKDEERTFQIVGTNESDPGSGKLSHSSPVGRAVLKRRAGDKVTVITPRGATEYEIVNVEAAS